MKLPNMYRIRQSFDDARVEDIRETVKAELGGLSWSAIRPGDRVGRSRPVAVELPILLKSWAPSLILLNRSKPNRFSSPPWAAMAGQWPKDKLPCWLSWV